MNMQKKDWTLLAIAAAKEGGLTPAQLQKSLFLIEKNYPGNLDSFYKFEPYNYGPFDKTVYEDARSLASVKMVKMNGVQGQRWSKYYVTPEGEVEATRLQAVADAKLVAYLSKVVQWAQGLSFTQLVSSIYKHYPDYKINSVFREQ